MAASNFEGRRLDAKGYVYEDALTLQHLSTGIKMWARAIDVREEMNHKGLRPGDCILYRYTDRQSFLKITSLEDPKLLVNMDESKDSYFAFGVYATERAPHQWKSKDAVRLNNYYPTAENLRCWIPNGQELPGPDANFEKLLRGAVGDYVKHINTRKDRLLHSFDCGPADLQKCHERSHGWPLDAKPSKRTCWIQLYW